MKLQIVGFLLFVLISSGLHAAEVIRHSLPNNSTFPIARAVEVPESTRLVFHSGVIPKPMNEKAKPGSVKYWGNTQRQTVSVFRRMDNSLRSMGLTFSDVVKLTVFLVGDPQKNGKMDFEGFMNAYSKFFGTEKQPNLPARSVVQVSGLVSDGMLIEIEAILVRPN